MDFWASLEHQMRYKREALSDWEAICDELKTCADIISETDAKMLEIRKKIELAEDKPSEDEVLFERLRKLDVPIK